jgi:hypothetical protein
MSENLDLVRPIYSAWEHGDYGSAHWAHPEIQFGEERVLVLHTWSGRGKTSGLSVDRMQAKSPTLFRIRDGKVTRPITYWTVARALADLGLAE